MKYTTFDAQKWNLTTFKKIGYDREKKNLYIYFYTGNILEFINVNEKDVFQLVISTEKERYIQEMKSTYDFIHHPRSSLA
ncbi:KTSC domain-containing protein [Melghiribacillus thermohalophilus]|uniref:KTSC domain-containing protein n=1 Tax=Melghiribacillus thermohalophilus TaxID=1324956 RepID=A0A4R3NBR6_9BACI|nr:KTSC domain-containing protein [Melghiribacillus thermohalophilus]TCT27067.1 KTSC domain-containing protein [Melghiribacillus thermohalophilus]